MLAKNEVLQDRYRIVRPLGHGGMGAVYEARDERLGSSVALKEIIIELDQIPTPAQRDLFRRAFEREAKLLANLHHEVFPRVMDYFSEENRQFLVMELVSGDDLGKLLVKNKKPFALETALRWADHLLDALDYLHTQDPPIFHRDIKPENLKATTRGRIKLLDFGIAKSFDRTASTMTNQTFVGATLDYAPIEQLLPAMPRTFREFIVLKHSAKANAVLNQNTDARCDIYAVGATFYHLLTNCVPVDSAKRALEVWEGNNDPLPNPSELNAGLPPAVSAWLMKALEIEREDRFSSALEMQQALQTALEEAKRAAKPFVAPEPSVSANENDASRSAAHSPLRAKTENLLESESARLKSDQSIIAETQAAPTQSVQVEPSATEAPLPEPPDTGSSRFESSGTKPSGRISKSELTGLPYYDKELVEPEKPRIDPAPVPFADPKTPAAKSGFNIFWLLPIFAVGLLAIGGIGGGIGWMNGFASSNTTKPVSNTTVSTPVRTPSPSSPTVSPTVSPTPTPTPNNSVKNEDKPKPTPTVSPTPTPAQVKTPIQNPVKTPSAPKTPKTKPSQDPNCVFTNSCG
ncbi:MAG: serine/threonine protein kinase [Acidobacteria bacterium]|nr:serine/threonine protein kinase [Acidobacteriota bacterium]